MNSFRKIFNPTKEELLEKYKKLLNIHNDLLYDCSTCKFYISTTLPGFVSDCGDCSINSPIFVKKVINRKIRCPNYREDDSKINKIKEKIKELECDFNKKEL